MEAKLAIIGLLVITIPILASVNSFGLVFAQQLTKNQIKQCEVLYFNYKKFGEETFLKRYSFKSFIKECVKLYKDPKWTFPEKDKIDKYFEKLKETKKTKDTENSYEKPITTIRQKTKVSEAKYLVGFQTCIKSEKGILPSFLISSDLEKFIGTSSKAISAKSCQNYWTYIKTKLPNTILVDYIEEPSKYPTLKVKKLEGKI
jgi:hypothetical protein